MTKLKTPITYYGGKQRLASKIISLIPEHNLYAEPFFGGGAVFFQKISSPVEVINDTNAELINFYRVVKHNFKALKKEINASLHSRNQHRQASVIYNNSDMFDKIKRAWAVWFMAGQGFSSQLDMGWRYDVRKSKVPQTTTRKKTDFTSEYAARLENTQIECTDALRIIHSRDRKDSFFYCDPPYHNANQGHYNGYTIEDFENLLKTLSQLKGKFLLSSYPSPLLTKYIKKYKWHSLHIDQPLMAAKERTTRKRKIEVLTANYPITLENIEKIDQIELRTFVAINFQ